MPLILICGHPSSGKTTRALEIKKYIEENHKKEVLIINEEYLKLDKKEAYKDYNQEKLTRAFLRSNLEKNLSADNIVILDSLNYIKGYRYEMFCLVRSAKTTHCIVFCNTSKAGCKAFQEKNPDGLSEEAMMDFYNRMEIPNAKNRWDSPLFELRETEKTPLEDIVDVILFQEKKAKDPVSTKTEEKYEENFLFELDKRVQNIIDEILQKQKDFFMQGVTLTFPGCTMKLKLLKTLSSIELKNFKKEYLNICKASPPKTVEAIGDSFISFLTTAVERL